ncbi:type II toxin-antitoxin system RelE/ParE family toxin [Sphingopyxis panaciterrulae]|uniref:Putative addiction module killer protein n=1 Tax=Sphingopyxis panaciterrulae TaxID=462372 RepID=A0A7W9B6C4_9SPHN|nr:type II toxin-antitoxin system RelE/ParE family toxin [Sphingopyxis panaciterrulae]MBB5707090.1 putative addiction module killer protein [Sphingopyxis panaciterrulae]
MIEIRRTDIFDQWMAGLRDVAARARILKRIGRLGAGNMGDAKPVGGGVSELRFTFGRGYRVYFTRRGDRILLLLCGGDKSSQGKDIARAKALAKEVE